MPGECKDWIGTNATTLPKDELTCDALDKLESPIDLHEHHHEELVVRTERELAE